MAFVGDDAAEVEQFIAVSCATASNARRYLAASGGDVQRALEILESGRGDELGDESAAPCANSCGRLAAAGFRACCRTCVRSRGESHGPMCEAAHALADGPPLAHAPGRPCRARSSSGSASKPTTSRFALVGSFAPVSRGPLGRRDRVSKCGKGMAAKRSSADRSAAAAVSKRWEQSRLTRLVEKLLSPAVQAQVPVDAVEEPARLSAAEISTLFAERVPGVHEFLYRQQPGVPSLTFIQEAYREGLSAFRGTALDKHLTCLLRLVVHHGHEGKPGSKAFLREVAEAFMDCQAVQARAIERVGLQIQGFASDFRGLVVALVGEYKAFALKMLAQERIINEGIPEDASATHYENRLAADLGDLVGLNASDIRRAMLDVHAKQRFACLRKCERREAAARCRDLFDMGAFITAFMSEVNSFSAESAAESLPRLFLGWSNDHLEQKHVVFDEDTCSRVEVGDGLALAVLETLFLGRVDAAGAAEFYRGARLCEIFHTAKEGSAAKAPASSRKRARAEIESKEREEGDEHEEREEREERGGRRRRRRRRLGLSRWLFPPRA